MAAVPPFALAFFTIVRETGWLGWLLSLQPFQFLGKISYSLYLVHPFVMDPARTAVIRLLAPRWGTSVAVGAFYVIAPLLAVGVATLSYEWIERRLTRRLFPETRRDPRSGPVLREAG